MPTFSKYVPEDILQRLGDTVQQKSGLFWAIPSDGLVELALSAGVLGITLEGPASEREASLDLTCEKSAKENSICCVFSTKPCRKCEAVPFLYSTLIPSPAEGYVISWVEVRALTDLMICMRGTSNGRTKISDQCGTHTKPLFSCPWPSTIQ